MGIKLNNINYIKDDYHILKDITLTINDAQVTLIYGNSGSGKTSLINLISGLNKANSGIIDNSHSKIGYLFQFASEQIFNDTVFKELTYSLINLNKEEKIVLAKEYLKKLNIDENLLDKNPFTLSPSTIRKINLGCALITDPDIIILDEPTINLTDQDKLTFISIIKQLKNKHKTIIIVSHDIDLFYSLADDFIILDNGRVLISGKKDIFISNYENLKEKKIYIPTIINFSIKVKENKHKNIGFYSDFDDLLKAVYRNV